MASARGMTLERVVTTGRGSLEVRGVLMIDMGVSNGFDAVDLEVTVDADASRGEIEELIESARQRSSIYSIVTEAIPVNVSVGEGTMAS